MNDVRSVILFGNQITYIDAIVQLYVKRKFCKDSLITRKSSFAYVNYSGVTCEVEYDFSDVHFVVEYSDKHIKFIKEVIKNKNIANKQFVFVIKNIDSVSKTCQLPLKILLDSHANIQFVFIAKNITNIENSILSRSFALNTSFPVEHIYALVRQFSSNLQFEDFEQIYNDCNRNVLITLSQIEHKNAKPKLFVSLDTLLDALVKEKNQLQLVMLIREYVYKVYHLSFPLEQICKYAIDKYKDESFVYDIAKLAAECNVQSVTGSKSIFTYEKFFLRLLQIIK